MKSGTLKHPKTLALAEELRRRFPALSGNLADHVAVSVLARLWDWAALYAPTGHLGRWSHEAVARGVEFSEDATSLMDGLVASGWLDACEESGLAIHGWHEHCEGWVHSKLARKGECFHGGQMPNFRYLKSEERATIKARFCESTTESVDSPQSRMRKPLALSHIPLANKEDSSELPPSGNSKPPPLQDDSEILMAFEVVGNPKTWELRQSLKAKFEEAYPGLDVLAECRKAVAWLTANPTKRKTARGMAAFLNRWIAKAIDSPRGSGIPKAIEAPTFKIPENMLGFRGGAAHD